MIKYSFQHESFSQWLLNRLLWTLIWVLPAFSGAATDGDYTAHHHVAHLGDSEHHVQGKHEDPHAHHRRVMERTGYARSEHDYELPDLSLVAMDGSETSLLNELNRGQPVMVNFIFATCTTICPLLSATFTRVQEELGEERERVRLVSVTIDPEYDTPERLRTYAKRFEAGPQWQFLTGKLADIVAIQKAFDVYRGNKMNHEPTTLLRAAKGGRWVRLDGIVSAANIVREYEQLIGR